MDQNTLNLIRLYRLKALENGKVWYTQAFDPVTHEGTWYVLHKDKGPNPVTMYKVLYINNWNPNTVAAFAHIVANDYLMQRAMLAIVDGEDPLLIDDELFQHVWEALREWPDMTASLLKRLNPILDGVEWDKIIAAIIVMNNDWYKPS